MNAPVSLQVCVGQEASPKATIHGMYDFYKDKHLGAINRIVMLYNISVLCPTILAYVSNCYKSGAHLIVISGYKRSNYSRQSNIYGNIHTWINSFTSFST